MNAHGLTGYDAYIFDLDGCVYFGERPAEAAADLVGLLQALGKETFFLSNNSSHAPEEQREKLRAMGIETDAEHIYLASTITGRSLRERHGPCRVCVAGADGLAEQLRLLGHTTEPPDSDAPCDFLVVGRDPLFSMQRLEHCAEQIRRGSRLIATNLDTYQPTLAGGMSPETGALVAAITAMTRAEPDSVGKPNPYAFSCIMDDFGLPPERCLMIGDNPATDIRGARLAGMDACWITLDRAADGHHGEAEPPIPAPAFVFASIHALYRAVLHAVPGERSDVPRETA
ncbi:HAD-IIA family hydrolase [Desulfocurvus sp. DL9XJH121]